MFTEEMSSKRYIQLGSLVQLLESPSFTHIRIQMMKQNDQTKYLIKTLQGILMILPQSKTFNVLKTRLDCVNITSFSLPLAEDEINDPLSEEEKKALKEQNKQSLVKCLEQYKMQMSRYKNFNLEQTQAVSKLRS